MSTQTLNTLGLRELADNYLSEDAVLKKLRNEEQDLKRRIDIATAHLEACTKRLGEQCLLRPTRRINIDIGNRLFLQCSMEATSFASEKTNPKDCSITVQALS